MNADVERLVREGLDRLAAAAEAPAGLAARARRRHRRRQLAAGSAVAGGIATVTAVAVIVTAGAAAGPGGQAGAHRVTRAQTDAYLVLRHMESAFAQQNLVMRGDTTSKFSDVTGYDRSVTWSYRHQSRFVEFWHGKRYLADGTAEIHGTLRAVYVTYFDRRWSGGGRPVALPSNACGKNAVVMGGPALPASDWQAFIKSTISCGDAAVTGHVWIHGVRTVVITGSPLTVGLPKGMVKATNARVTYQLYVNPSTYLPARMSGTTFSYGPKTASYAYRSVTDVTWLRPTAANVARTLITIPPGFRHVKSAADQ